MREGLYIGKRTDNGMWIQGYFFKCWSKAYILWGMTGDSPNMHEVIPETVGQSTGLKDKNGQMIFEGDIIEYPPKRKKFVVEFYNDCFGARDNKNKRTRIGSGDDFIIIGDIYDNPELLT
jgi:hypothetical protein